MLMLILLSPLLALAWRSFTLGGHGLTLRYFRALTVNRTQDVFFVTPMQAIRNSLLYALGRPSGSSAFGKYFSAYLLARRRSWVTRLIGPHLSLAPGHIGRHPRLRLHHRSGPWQPAHLGLADPHRPHPDRRPFVVRTLLPALRGLDPHLREAGQVLGANPVRVWWEVDVPLLWRAPCSWPRSSPSPSAWANSAPPCSSTGPTCPPCRWSSTGPSASPGLVNYGQALAMSTILMAVSAAGILLIERFRVDDAEF